MKTVEDIERLTPEELEKMADDESIAVPENLERNIENRILAFEMTRRRRRLAFIPAAAAAVAAVIVGLSLHIGSRTASEACGTLSDTFSTPEEAYAQVEKTFSLIGSKVGRGKSIADAAVPKMQRTSAILNTGFTSSPDSVQ